MAQCFEYRVLGGGHVACRRLRVERGQHRLQRIGQRLLLGEGRRVDVDVRDGGQQGLGRGVELCGALKNVIAVACGIAKGIGCGDNAKAALITLGITEMSRLGAAMGCREQTFSGLSGIGDLIVTATSMHSRNYQCGILLGKGVPIDQALLQVGMVVEGINTLPAAIMLAKKYNVYMPIIETVNAVVSETIDESEIIRLLMPMN